jgi:hypothetical protein
MKKSSTPLNFQSKQSTQIYLNSGSADFYMNNTKKSNICFCFQQPIQIHKNTIEMRMSIVNAQIPISWYLINSNNNKIIITVNSVTTTYYFKHGNYNINSFITEWNNSIGPGWVLTFDSVTNKIKFVYTSNFIFTDTDPNTLFPIIGFNSGTTYTSSSFSLTSPFCVNFAGITSIKVKSSTFNLGNLDSYKKGKSRTLASIPVNSVGSGYILYHNYTQYSNIFKNYELSTIGIEIQDDFLNYIDFNNVDWSMTLQIDVIGEIIQDIDSLTDVYENLAQEY